MMDVPESYLKKILDFNIKNDFVGYDKFDGINNVITRSKLGRFKWIRFFFQQLVKESPFNLRFILKVKKTQNIKGNALFIQSLIKASKIFKDPNYLKIAEELADKQLNLSSKDFNSLSWGHNFIWEGISYSLPAFYPNLTNTVFSGNAFIDLFEVTGEEKYLSFSKSIKNAIFSIFPLLVDSCNKKALSYFPFKSFPICINIQALTAEFLHRLNYFSPDQEVTKFADQLLNFVIKTKNDNYSWYYNYPRKNYLLKKDYPDNYHSAFILDSLLTIYYLTNDKQTLEIYQKGLHYYTNNLFFPSGMPKWNARKKYPADIHGSAAAIISLSKSLNLSDNSSNKELLEKVFNWTLKNMYNEKDGFFIYRKSRFFRYNYRLNRWSDAWMSLALATYIEKRELKF